ncbi:unnamed protein product, partial [Rotaria magnacalcarata]
FNDGFDPLQFDFFQTTETSPDIQNLLDASTMHTDITTENSAAYSTSTISTFSDSTTSIEHISSTFDSTFDSTLITTEQMTTTENSTHSLLSFDTTSFNNETSTSNERNSFSSDNNTLWSTLSYSIENESISMYEQMNETTETIFNDTTTIENFVRNNSDLIVDLFNHTYPQGKNLIDDKQYEIYNTTAEEAAQHLADRRTMQSLIHLLPPNLWSQLQKNLSLFNFNQSQFIQPALPDPVILAEAAAQAGLPGPGPYPIPDHLWHQNMNYYRDPSQFINNIPIETSSSTTTTTTTTTT